MPFTQGFKLATSYLIFFSYDMNCNGNHAYQRCTVHYSSTGYFKCDLKAAACKNIFLKHSNRNFIFWGKLLEACTIIIYRVFSEYCCRVFSYVHLLYE